MKILAIGSPKGGVGKTTVAVNLADLYARAGLRVLFIDADDNGSAAYWINHSDGAISVDWDQVDRPRTLRQLAAIEGYDVLVIDLPGSARKGGELRALLSGDDGRPVSDFLLVPTECAELDIQAVGQVLPELVADPERGRAGVPHAVVFTKVWPTGAVGVSRTREEYRRAGWIIADTLIRRYGVHQDAATLGRSIVGMPGQGGARRGAEQDMRDLAREVAEQLGLRVTIDPLPDDHPTPSPVPRSRETS